ncbi:helix-turn-helix transcriptional regulator [Streptomyces sp. MS1.AVA.1]|uniref:Helix-turn-helix transcriptional regulator n=1 Tax=Streptomyces machairae TaxID=3134109 RepID=A0ABU8USN9_9ACTN
MATRDLVRLAKRVKAHRLELYPSRLAAAQAAGISKDTWHRIEEGQDVREATYAKVDKALGWATGSCVLIAEGQSPVLAGEPDRPDATPRMTESEMRDAAFALAAQKLPSAPIGDVQAFVEELVKVLQKTGEVANGS